MKNSTRTGEPEAVAVHMTEEPLNTAPSAKLVVMALPEVGGGAGGGGALGGSMGGVGPAVGTPPFAMVTATGSSAVELSK